VLLCVSFGFLLCGFCVFLGFYVWVCVSVGFLLCEFMQV